MTADSGTDNICPSGWGSNCARYLAGSALSLSGQAGQQTQTLRLASCTGIGSPIEPSFARVTGQILCCSTVIELDGVAWSVGECAAAIRARIWGVWARGVLSVTVANIPGW